MPLRWERVDLHAGLFRVVETKAGIPLELPVTRQLGEILARRRAGGEAARRIADRIDELIGSCVPMITAVHVPAG